MTTELIPKIGAVGTLAQVQTNADGSISLLGASGEIISLTPASYTWAGKPAASASNSGQTIRITDIGNDADGSLWKSDGTAWRPVGNRLLVDAAGGTLASPLATYTGAAAGNFTLPAGNPLIPADVLPVGAIVRVEAYMRRHGANGTATFNIRLGTAGTNSDSVFYQVTTTATDNKDQSSIGAARITSSSTFTTTGFLLPGNAGVLSMVDKSTNINTASGMYVSFDMAGANALDSFDLISYSVWAEF